MMHALVRERQNGYLQIAGRNCFNSRPYARSDPKTDRVHTHIIDVSIHAPVRERLYMSCFTGGRWTFQFTLPRRERPAVVFCIHAERTFQFTLPRRERPRVTDISPSIFKFQFTLPRRERRQAPVLPPVRLRFQFTLPRRERLSATITESAEKVSIHAPAKGATHLRRGRRGDRRFQFTLPRRERLCFENWISADLCFNSRSREGSDVGNGAHYARILRFNSRSREGSDRDCRAAVQFGDVSIHAPAKGTTLYTD